MMQYLQIDEAAVLTLPDLVGQGAVSDRELHSFSGPSVVRQALLRVPKTRFLGGTGRSRLANGTAELSLSIMSSSGGVLASLESSGVPAYVGCVGRGDCAPHLTLAHPAIPAYDSQGADDSLMLHTAVFSARQGRPVAGQFQNIVYAPGWARSKYVGAATYDHPIGWTADAAAVASNWAGKWYTMSTGEITRRVFWPFGGSLRAHVDVQTGTCSIKILQFDKTEAQVGAAIVVSNSGVPGVLSSDTVEPSASTVFVDVVINNTGADAVISLPTLRNDGVTGVLAG